VASKLKVQVHYVPLAAQQPFLVKPHFVWISGCVETGTTSLLVLPFSTGLDVQLFVITQLLPPCVGTGLIFLPELVFF